LQVLPGVASVIIGGERRYAMRVWLNREYMAARGVTPGDVEHALRQQNVDIPSGRIESTQREFTVLTESDLRTAEEFNDLIIRSQDGYPVRLRDVGFAEISAEDERKAVRVNGNQAVGLGVVKQSNANTLSVGKAVKQTLPRIRDGLPEGMKIQVAFDRSVFVDESIKAVYTTMLEALVLVVLVIFLFLRSVRGTLIPVVTIPVSLIGAFIFLYAMGFTINILTLLGLVLAIGLVVDDAIVMLENVHRHVEGGASPRQAALVGSKEIAFAIIAMTITLAAVFTPLAFMTGNIGRLFSEFALTVASAVLVSGFVALTLTPMMCSKLLRAHQTHGRFYQTTERWLHRLNTGYGNALKHALRVRWAVVLVGLAVGGSSALWYTNLKSELSPIEDRGIILTVIVAPEGSTMEYTDTYARQIETMFAGIPEVNTYFMVIAPGLQRPNPVNSAIGFVSLKPWDERERKQQQIAASLQPQMGELPGVLAFPINPPSLGQSFRNPPIQFVVQGPSYAELEKFMDVLIPKAREYPGLTNVDTDLKLNKPQLSVFLDRDKIADTGADVETIGRTLETMLGGRQVTRFKREGEQYDVIVQVLDKDRVTPEDITSIYVRGRDGLLIQLSNLLNVDERVAPKELNHFNRLRAVKISANVTPGYSLGEALAFLENAAKELLPPTADVELDGESREFREAGAALYLTFGLALVFIYLVLSAQFESFVDPFIIMLTVPLAVAGGLLALNVASLPAFSVSGSTLNVYSQIGLVMLVGLITKHGILIVEFANQLRDRGMDRFAAVSEAAALRLRPILMTTAAMVLGAGPLAFAAGAGAESRHAIGLVIVGGLLIGTFFTLFVIPVAYTLLARRGHGARTEATAVGDATHAATPPRAAP
ncbi:MAG: efflux RND transporter permease subunit, partial [Gammaproteobacteria bacterium]|nr:efflux RND transporter permease subunit [Gammaproteobacteria bacterium]